MATDALAGNVLSERFWLEISCSMGEMVGCCCGAAAVLVAAVALSYFSKKMKMQAAATCAGAIEGVHVSEFPSPPAALALVGMHSKTIWHAAAAMSVAKGDRYVPESLFAIVDNWPRVRVSLDNSGIGILLGPVVSWICDVGRAPGKELWSVSGECKKQSSPLSKEKGSDGSLLQASTQAEAYECISFKGKDGMTLTVASPWDWGRLQDGWTSPSVSACCSAPRRSAGLQSVCRPRYPWLLRRENDFLKRVDGSTTVHRVKGHTVVGELLDCTVDVWGTYNGRKVNLVDTMAGIGNHDTIRSCGRLRGGARQHQLTSLASGRAWRVDKKGFGLSRIVASGVGALKGHSAPQPDPYVARPLGRLPQRSASTNPSYRPQRQNPKPIPPTGTTQNFPPLTQPLPVGVVDASASGSVPPFPAGSWLFAFLQQIMSPEDYQKYKSSFEHSPQKEEVPLAVQLANKTKERGT